MLNALRQMMQRRAERKAWRQEMVAGARQMGELVRRLNASPTPSPETRADRCGYVMLMLSREARQESAESTPPR